MDAASSARPPPAFDYPLVHEGERSHRPEEIPSPSPMERGWEVSHSDGRPHTGRCTAMEPTGRPTQGTTTGSATASTPYATHSRRTTWLEEQEDRLLSPHHLDRRTFGSIEFHEQSRHSTTECRALKKALHELADKGQINLFLNRGPRFLRREQEPAPRLPRDEECSTEVMATIVGGYAEGITRSVWKAQLRNAQ
ncbi:LOW QUALITY PROTEIN: hypothetical protein Cgig2_001946 [Carnegiea gigantea]|uniref:Uncharacterized protein n=1 Tax=Carnegiea gigantea TaxID=171969 RepID=A0A9Q1QA87_9CARY|nr:LOW QUALITY PROTEIN: hypothetical protein Cgig2_001946 [Carnegiea gigantea]